MARQLAGRGDWPGLWRFTRDSSVARGVELVRLLPDGWRPDGEADRRLFGTLTAIPATVAVELGPTACLTTPRWANRISVAPAGREVAVLGQERVDGPAVLAVYALVGSHGYATVATEPRTGRIALRDPDLVMLDERHRPVARATDVGAGNLEFVDPDRLVGHKGGSGLTIWRRDQDRLVVEASVPLPPYAQWVQSVVALPTLGLVVARYNESSTWKWYRTPELVEVPSPDGERFDGVEFRGDPATGWVASGDFPGVRMVRLRSPAWLSALVDRPMAGMRPADLAAVSAADTRDLDPEVAAVAAGLRACLEHRFGAEIALGAAGSGSHGDDDIALGGRAGEVR